MNRYRVAKILLLLQLVLPVVAMAQSAVDDAAATYQALSEDKQQEQQRFLERLKQDKTKLDLAIGNTKSLIDRSRQRPYLPELYLRLAELYIEKSRTVYFIRKAELPDGVKSLNNLESNTLKKQAIEIYQRILDSFPQFPYPDKVHFFMAHEFRELGQIEEMLAQYKTIIKKFPASAYAPEAYLLLGDHFFTMQELELAKRHYQAVLAFIDSPALAVARYKLAWCYINQADYKQALQLFEAAVQAAGADRDTDIDTYRKVDIKLESLIDLAYCYVEERKKSSSQKAIKYFEEQSWSRAVYMIALEKLAYRYFIKKKWQHSGDIYRTLAALENDPEKLLVYAGRVFECVRAIGTFENADQDMALIVKALEKQKYSTHIDAAEKAEKFREYELYARDIVTHLHQKALAGKAVDAFALAASAYQAYLDFFEESDVYDEMAMNYAETLFAARDYHAAGKQFEALSSSKLRSERERRDHLYSAVLSYYLALKNPAELSAYQKVYARGGLRSAGRLYTSEYPQADKVANVLFNMAWVAYDEGKFQVAIDEFSRFVSRYPKTAEAKAAVHLILDAYNLMEDYEGLVEYGQFVLASAAFSKGLKEEVDQIVRASESKVLNPLALAAVDDWDQGKQDLIKFAEQHQSSPLGEQALQAVVASSSELQDLPTLYATAAELLHKYPQSANVETTLNLVIETSLNASQFRQLADSLEEFARRLPQHASSPDFLYQAAQIRESLGQYAQANTDYGLARANKAFKTRDNGAIVWAMAENALRLADKQAALKLLVENERSLQGAARIRAQAQIAELARLTGKVKLAGRYRKEARKVFEKNGDLGDVAARDAIAEMESGVLLWQYQEYMGLQLQGSIDNEVVRRKGDLLGSLLKSYHKLMKLQSPKWALDAFYRAYEVNREFARFLLEAPLPELSADEQRQYAAIIKEKAAGYDEKANDYLASCIGLARKWEICDPELTAYFIQGRTVRSAPDFADMAPTASDDWLKDENLYRLHLQALKEPQDSARLLELATYYVEWGDYRHAILIAQRALKSTAEVSPRVKASLYNTLGVAYLYGNEDQVAKDALQKALAIQSDHRAARLNLGGLYSYYEHTDKAREIYQQLTVGSLQDHDGGLLHPRSREFYHAFNQYAQK